MGSVYKARLPELGALVALKTLRPAGPLLDVLGLDELKRRFVAEAQLMAGLRHPHVAAIYDLDEHQGLPFFTMEFLCHNLGACIGESYQMEASTRLIPFDVALEYCLQTLEGLGRLHAAGIAHRDVKPYNLLLTDEDRVKIIDFGLSRLRGELRSDQPKGMKIGTPYYAAPEQERDPDSVDGRADLYSVAVLLYRLVTGELPPEPAERPKDWASSQFTALARCAPAVGQDRRLCEQWVALLHRGLAPAPEKRFPDAASMAQALLTLREAWLEAREAVCRFVDPDAGTPADAFGAFPALRSVPRKTGPLDPSAAFGLDALGRPPASRGMLDPGRLVALDETNVLDRAARLVWRRGGSAYPMSWGEARAFVEEMRAEGKDWRLPTAEELATLLDPAPDAEALERRDEARAAGCLPSLFDARQRTIWSADRRSFASAWYLDALRGFVSSLDMSCQAWARPVRAAAPRELG
jgi:serine/threonine-protein kinase